MKANQICTQWVVEKAADADRVGVGYEDDIDPPVEDPGTNTANVSTVEQTFQNQNTMSEPSSDLFSFQPSQNF